MVAQNIAFGIIAAAMAIGAIRVVTTNNVVHAALWLVVVLGGAAAQYILLAAEFVAVTQVLIYIGAVIVLFLFGTMLTRARIGRADDLNNPQWPIALVVALALAGTLGYVLIDAFGKHELPKDSAVATQVPRLSNRWLEEVEAQRDWEYFTPADYERLKARFGINWVLIERPAREGLDCPYENAALLVCRVP